METMGNLRRTDYCAEVGLADVGREMTVCGSIARARDKGGIIFADLRDTTGILQLVFDEDTPAEVFAKAEHLKSEYVVIARGALRERAAKTDKVSTGDVELYVAELRVLSEAQTPPFEIRDDIKVGDDLRLRYRYLDLRRPSMHEPIVLRSKICRIVRDYFYNEHFCEIETPTLIRSTPEGARDYLVPSRVQPGHFYALPQSPQLYKQILMLSGFDRYFQIARCYRDEDLRADRQPEFTQVDIEMSFVEQDDVMGALEDVLSAAFAQVGVEMPTPLRRLSYWDAMDTYGTDKPDTRYGMTLVDLTDVFAGSKFKVFSSAANTEGEVVKAINAKGAGAWPRAQIDKLAKVAETFGAKGLAWIAFREDGSINSPIVKFFSDEEMAELRRRCDVEPGDLVMFAAGPRLASDEILGGMRCHMADALDVPREGHDFLWVVDFPLFHWDDEAKRYEAEHQPFTLPHVDELDLLETDPLAMGSCTYDFVMDGFEAGGGGMRIHDSALQLKMLEFMGFTEERARAQFGFLMDALEFGAPPMGGFALGLDRVCMLLAGADSIRDVMAFPKTSSGSDLMSAAPSEVSMAQLKEVGLRLM